MVLRQCLWRGGDTLTFIRWNLNQLRSFSFSLIFVIIALVFPRLSIWILSRTVCYASVISFCMWVCQVLVCFKFGLIEIMKKNWQLKVIVLKFELLDSKLGICRIQILSPQHVKIKLSFSLMCKVILVVKFSLSCLIFVLYVNMILGEYIVYHFHMQVLPFQWLFCCWF